jgi:hypothetical protein
MTNERKSSTMGEGSDSDGKKEEIQSFPRSPLSYLSHFLRNGTSSLVQATKDPRK